VVAIRPRSRSCSAHVDAVEARGRLVDGSLSCTTDGFSTVATTDNKGGAALLVANMMRWKREGYVPARDVILILTTDEETSAEQGILWLLAHVPALKYAEYALNTDAGGLLEQGGKPPRFFLQSSEKMYQTFQLEVTNRGGALLAAARGQCDLCAGPGAGAAEQFSLPVGTTRSRAKVFAPRAMERGQLAADYAALASGVTSGPASSACRRSCRQRQPAHHLRRDKVERGHPRMPPAAGNGDGQLPHLSGVSATRFRRCDAGSTQPFAFGRRGEHPTPGLAAAS
jgi:hypothetical protein